MRSFIASLPSGPMRVAVVQDGEGIGQLPHQPRHA